MHIDPLQKLPGAQSAIVAQLVRHAEPEQMYAPQPVLPPLTQEPAPSHVLAFTCVFPEQLCATHSVPLAYLRHAPAPSHSPSLPHVVSGCASHSPSGSVPSAIAPQVPSAPPPFFAVLHAWHVALHASSQHTPSEQKPLWHSEPDPHAVPSGEPPPPPPPLLLLLLAVALELDEVEAPPVPQSHVPHVPSAAQLCPPLHAPGPTHERVSPGVQSRPPPLPPVALLPPVPLTPDPQARRSNRAAPVTPKWMSLVCISCLAALPFVTTRDTRRREGKAPCLRLSSTSWSNSILGPSGEPPLLHTKFDWLGHP